MNKKVVEKTRAGMALSAGVKSVGEGMGNKRGEKICQY